MLNFYEVHETQNFIVLILELVENGDLRTIIDENKGIPEF